MGYNAKIIADSINPSEQRLTSVQVTFPRFILAELTRHRMFSFSVQSSRAIPVEKLIKQITEDPVRPLEWGKNCPGMSANEELKGYELESAKYAWERACHIALSEARELCHTAGAHKQIVNRILEPFSWTTALISSTSWDNFFGLRISDAAQPEIKHLAELMKTELDSNTPTKIYYNSYHLPYITAEDHYSMDEICAWYNEDWEEWNIDYKKHTENLKKVSAARCARLSYLTHDNKRDIIKDIELTEKKLIPMKHYSPLEHIAIPCNCKEDGVWNGKCYYSGNFSGWHQYRHEVQP